MDWWQSFNQSMKSLNFMIFSHKNHFYSNERSILHTYELSAIKFDDNTRDIRMPLKGQNERVINVSVWSIQRRMNSHFFFIGFLSVAVTKWSIKFQRGLLWSPQLVLKHDQEIQVEREMATRCLWKWNCTMRELHHRNTCKQFCLHLVGRNMAANSRLMRSYELLLLLSEFKLNFR